MVLDGVMKCHELDPFLLGMMHFLHTCGHLFFRTAVDDHRTLCSQTFRGTNGIHRGVATTDDSYVLAVQNRRVGSRIGSVHQVHTGQVLVTRHHAVQVLARDVHESRQTCA